MDKETIREQERQLLERVIKKDKNAFEALYKLTSQSVYFYLYRLLQSKEAAEDIHVEVYTQVWKNAGKFQGKSRVKTWIFGIARNLALNEIRRETIRKTQELNETFRDDHTENRVNQFAQKQHLQAAMDQVSAKHREVLDLVFYHELSYQEVSMILEIPENTVKTRVYYAKAALKEKLIEMEV
ncbi:MAG: sigma-70 family RNA polymerase sigma factor [Desulfobacteraceae bacterium]|nr:MAG: sigma-70 family RNA polymerase sigma factor [Desulfobacteraceae bacterium]